MPSFSNGPAEKSHRNGGTHHRAGFLIERHTAERIVHRWTAAFRSFPENQGGICTAPPPGPGGIVPAESHARRQSCQSALTGNA